MALSSRNVSVTVDTAQKTANFTHSMPYTVGAGTELLVVVIEYLCNTDGFTISAVQWDGTGLTHRVSETSASLDNNISIWTLTSPTAGGPLNIDVFFVETVGTATEDALAVIAAEVIGGVNLTTPVPTVASDNGSGTADAFLTITTANASSLVISGVQGRGNDTDPFTGQGGITAELAEGDSGGGSTTSDIGYWAGEALTTTAGNYDVGATMSVIDGWSVAAIEIAEAVASGATVQAAVFSARRRRL